MAKQGPKHELTARLLAWYDAHGRDLPWRAKGERPDSYHVWLSEIMLQQTTVGAVKAYFAKFLELWPTVEALAAAPLDDVLRAWAGLGYYARARNLHACAGVVANELSLKRALLGGEPWSEEQRRRIEAELHVTATDNYALSEVMGPGIAGECLERNGLHVFEDHFLVEVVDPLTRERVRPGERGELVLTTLTKEAFPLVRYRTGELTSLIPEPCPCGRTSVRMRPVQARSDDMLTVKGVNVYPSQVEEVLEGMQGPDPRFQLVVDRPRTLDQATVLVEVSEAAFFDEMKKQSEFRETIQRRLASELGVGFEVKLVTRKTLDEELQKSGKVVDLRRR